jgi:hypothetical protein
MDAGDDTEGMDTLYADLIAGLQRQSGAEDPAG